MDFYNNIEAYHKNLLDSETKALMDEAMATDSDLKEAVENYDKIEPVLDLLVEEELRDQMESIKKGQSYKLSPSKKPVAKTRVLPTWKWISIAAAIGLLVGMFFMLSENKTPANQIYAAAYKEPNFSPERGTPTGTAVSSDEALYIAAHEAFENKQPAKARELLQQISNPNENRKDEIEWFVMLSYGIEGNTSKAKELLDQIVADVDHLYNKYDDAEKLQVNLKE